MLTGGAARAQKPIGQWQLIAPGTSASRLVEADNALYVAGDFGLFRYDLGDNSVRTLSKQDGLASVQVAALAYDSATRLVVIGYRDTNIDLLDPRTGTITNVADIQRRTIVGIKAINAITTDAGRAYVACSFGIVVIDLRRVEVANTYSGLGRNGENVAIRAVAVRGDSVLASTFDGLLTGRISSNLLDYRNWSLDSSFKNAPSLAVFNRHFYLVNDYSGLHGLGPTGWHQVPGGGGGSNTFTSTSLTASHGVLTIVQPNENRVSLMRPDESVTNLPPLAGGSLTQALAGIQGRYFIADRNRGLLVTDGTAAAPTVIAPNGPSTDVSFYTVPVGADVYGFAGGYSSGTGPFGRLPGFAHRQGGQWRMYSSTTVPNPAHYPVGQDADLSAAAWNPVNQKLYLASYGDGLIEWSGPDAPFRRFDSDNSPLVITVGGRPGYTRLAGVAVDPAGLVWIANFNEMPSEPGLFSFDPATGQFRSYPGGPGAELAHQVVIDDNGYKWVTCFPKPAATAGIYATVYKDDGVTYRTLTAQPNSGGLLGPIYAIAKDRKGDMWVGTSKGVQVFYNTGSVFASGAYAARQPIIERRPLLDNQLVKVIAVDGANRKWIGTDDGLYLFGEDGDEAIAHYTAENSPLPSNSVNSLSINGVTGEVFVGTDNGLVSFRGSATEPTAEAKPACSTVFPNPVPARFTGQIAIDGLTGGATVKITDVAGQLVYETKANGGRAVWNARDYQGRRVRTGIYLAYAANADGQNTCVSKIAVMGE